MDEKLTSSLDDYIVGSVPAVYYIPDFITAAEEEQLLNKIYKAPISKWKALKNRRLQNWGGVVHEKGLLAQDLPPWLKNVTRKIYGESGLFPSEINHVLINEYLPHQGIMAHQDGPAYVPVVAILSLGSPVVMEFVPHPSCEESKQVSENSNEDATNIVHMAMSSSKWLNKYLPFSVALMPCSLLIFKDQAYSDYLHGINDCEIQQFSKAVNVDKVQLSDGEERIVSSLKVVGQAVNDETVIRRTQPRVSLTCRVVSRVCKNLLKI